jgi:hypothetical protein
VGEKSKFLSISRGTRKSEEKGGKKNELLRKLLTILDEKDRKCYIK